MRIKESVSPELKAKIALLAMREDQTMAEIASEHGVHPNQISQWKKIAQENLSKVFSDKSRKCEHPELIEKLYRNIGELKVENDWIKKKLGI